MDAQANASKYSQMPPDNLRNMLQRGGRGLHNCVIVKACPSWLSTGSTYHCALAVEHNLEPPNVMRSLCESLCRKAFPTPANLLIHQYTAP
jgi:hypothetical protein